jgi:hypothetical protein
MGLLTLPSTIRKSMPSTSTRAWEPVFLRDVLIRSGNSYVELDARSGADGRFAPRGDVPIDERALRICERLGELQKGEGFMRTTTAGGPAERSL